MNRYLSNESDRTSISLFIVFCRKWHLAELETDLGSGQILVSESGVVPPIPLNGAHHYV